MKFVASSLFLASGALAAISTITTSGTPTTIYDPPTNIPSPGGPCTGFAYCLADTSPIILRCVNGIAQPGNCDDNLNEPQYGAVCVSYSMEAASCSAVNPYKNSTTTTSISTTPLPGTGVTTTATGNGTLSYTPTAPPVTSTLGSTTTGGSGPVSTGGAVGRWTNGAMLGAAVAVLGGVAVL